MNDWINVLVTAHQDVLSKLEEAGPTRYETYADSDNWLTMPSRERISDLDLDVGSTEMEHHQWCRPAWLADYSPTITFVTLMLLMQAAQFWYTEVSPCNGGARRLDGYLLALEASLILQVVDVSRCVL